MSEETNYVTVALVGNHTGEVAVEVRLIGPQSEEAFVNLFQNVVSGNLNATILKALFNAYAEEQKVVSPELVSRLSNILKEGLIKKIIDIDEMPVIRPLSALSNMSIKEG